MPSDDFNPNDLTEARRKALAGTIQPLTLQEMKELGEGLFPTLDNVWRERYFEFIEANPNAAFFHASTDDGIEIIYCRDKDIGMWFVPGKGMGPLPEKGLKAMKEISATA